MSGSLCSHKTQEHVRVAFENGADIAFRVKGDDEWIYTNNPLWRFDCCDYKVIDLEHDDYYW